MINWDREEIKNAILFLEEALKAKKVSEIESFVNRTFICLRRIKTIPKIATLINYNYYSPENSDLTIAKDAIEHKLFCYLPYFRCRSTISRVKNSSVSPISSVTFL